MTEQFPDAVFMRLPETEASVVQAGLPEPRPVALFGNLHMLTWLMREADQRALLSRCSDDVLAQRPWLETLSPFVYCVDGAGRPPEERPAPDWTDIIRRLPTAPVVRMIVLDDGERWVVTYQHHSRQISRRLGATLARGMAKYDRRKLH